MSRPERRPWISSRVLLIVLLALGTSFFELAAESPLARWTIPVGLALAGGLRARLDWARWAAVAGSVLSIEVECVSMASRWLDPIVGWESGIAWTVARMVTSVALLSLLVSKGTGECFKEARQARRREALGLPPQRRPWESTALLHSTVSIHR